MIFFGVPSVRQVRPENLFGGDDLHAFLGKLTGSIHHTPTIKKSCKEYFPRDSEKFWGQIITFVRWLGLQRLNETGTWTSVPIVDAVAKAYPNDKDPAHSLFQYLLQSWQWQENITSSPTVKPYALIIEILCALHRVSAESAYLSDDEFYWLGEAHLRNEDSLYQNTNITTTSILRLRNEGGWQRYKELPKAKTVHLSYPRALLRNSTVLDAPDGHKRNGVFIRLQPDKYQEASQHAQACRAEPAFRFTANPKDLTSKQRSAYSDFLYDPARVQRWLDAVGDKRWTPSPLTAASPIGTNSPTKFAKAAKLLAELDQLDTKFAETAELLAKLDELDKTVEAKQRQEQSILRDHLFKYSEVAKCGLCGRDLPIRLLTAAHIKPRSECEDAEKRDPNIVMPACLLGCDSLFEFGFVVVEGGTIAVNVSTAVPPTPALSTRLEELKGRKCTYWNDSTAPYFNFHSKNHRRTG